MMELLNAIMSLNFAAIFKIIGVDIMLGADNAVVIALACAALQPDMRNKAMVIGTAGAIALRAALLAAAGLLLGITGIKLAAGLYLIYVGYSLLMMNDGDEDTPKQSTTIWGAVGTIIVADFMMSLDNVMAVAGAAESAGPHSTLYAIAGIAFSIPIIILGAKYLTTLMDKFPIIIWTGAGLLGWVGAEMIVSDPLVAGYVNHDMEIFYQAAGFMSVILSVMAMRKFAPAKEEVNV